MVYTDMTIQAMKVAYAAHEGQTDRSGVPYIFHPIHLAEQMDDELSCTVALLHDVVEDTGTTLEMLQKEFPPEVVE
ncbi:MAG: HD domain-containing protein, partial [Wujia sp.]